MEESENIPVSNFCYACLTVNNGKSVESYVVCNEPLRAIFRMYELQLCYLCKKIAQRMETFILNVQSNQIWLDNFHNVTAKDLQTLKTQISVPISLSYKAQNSVEIYPEPDEMLNLKETLLAETFHNASAITVKIEKEESRRIDAEFFDEFGADYEPDPSIKEEDQPLNFLKQELEVNALSITKRKIGRPGRPKGSKDTKKRVKKIEGENVRKLPKHYKSSKESGAEAIHISVDQVKLELQQRSLDKEYINSEYKCESCVKGFTFKGTYDKHMEKHSPTVGSIKCKLCDQRFPSSTKLKDHFKNHTLRYKCISCDYTRANRHAVRHHYLTEHRPDQPAIYKCSQCSKLFRREVGLRRHMLYSHTAKSRVQCAYCGKTYACKEILKSHMIMRHPLEVSGGGKLNKRFVCPHCNKAFSAPSLLHNHIRTHSHRKDYYCVECDKSFKSEAILKRHLQVAAPHCNYAELPITCAECDKRFAIKRDLERHMNKIHLNIKPYQCDQCEKAYINLHNLREHQKLVHEGYKRPFKFPCTLCDKVFDRNQILKSHMRTHTGERPYQCSICAATFSQSSILGTHYKLIHLKLTRDGRPKGIAQYNHAIKKNEYGTV